MPLFATLVASIAAKFFALFVAMFGAKWGVRIAAAVALATGYIACVLYWSTLIGPWLLGILSTSYGYVLGLLFPPVSGTVLAGLITWWTCVAVQRYTSTLLKLAVG